VRCLELDLQRRSDAASSIVTAMDYDKSDIAAIYDAARALTPEGLRQWLDLISTHIDRSAISLNLAQLSLHPDPRLVPISFVQADPMRRVQTSYGILRP
jgi:hypothetical protein